ncbi:MAG: hypothetical protein ACK5Q5_12335 [Planctomycetaceae bacterium]
MRDNDLPNEAQQRVVITAASAAYATEVLALVGSIRSNWPDHPPVIVYDLGLTDETISLLKRAGVTLRVVPEFCRHWRKHFTWKIWCCKHTPADTYLWLDAGVFVLRPAPEAFVAMDRLGYFVQLNGYRIRESACAALRRQFPELSFDRLLSINAGVHGFNTNYAAALLDEAWELCQREELMAADHPMGRHDQDLLSALLHKHFSPVVFLDHKLYAAHDGPAVVNEQRIWVHRRWMHPDDIQQVEQRLLSPDGPWIPRGPEESPPPSYWWRARVLLAKLRGRFPTESNAAYDGVRDAADGSTCEEPDE